MGSLVKRGAGKAPRRKTAKELTRDAIKRGNKGNSNNKKYGKKK
ncbi:hypothetical protein GGQ99_001304 [Aminobacter niigataensis]|uniref:Uncharacterized protein n=1 Tax=Aminobacter niigataensis TaxID=83265 RepID=A0ABR6KYH7_9HYPH|nr:hypothetical protein [Aminobacter niigataensis]